jgi:hypothetical protein
MKTLLNTVAAIIFLLGVTACQVTLIGSAVAPTYWGPNASPMGFAAFLAALLVTSVLLLIEDAIR